MPLLMVLLVALVGAAPAPAGCPTTGYSYGGVWTAAAARGLSATLVPSGPFRVASGHVGAWVGVGGAGQGPGGEDAWLQIGIAAYPGGESEIYVEATLPGREPRYTTVLARATSKPHRVAVREVAPNVWRAILDGHPVSPAYALPGSHGRWQPMAAAESYDGGYTACNAYAFTLRRISVRGGSQALHAFATGGHVLRWLAPAALTVARG